MSDGNESAEAQTERVARADVPVVELQRDGDRYRLRYGDEVFEWFRLGLVHTVEVDISPLPPQHAPQQESSDETDMEEPPRDLTDVAATVMREADVRIRPGLAWRVADRLQSGAAVVALHQAGGWVRIRYGDGVEGWIRVPALDLGEVDESQILEQAAPALIAEWRGEEYGVMGQSADGAEVRLLQVLDERPTVIGAPIDEVRLLDADVTLEELPILIADETVVFPGDDFRVGQGKILPKANEWMWLPWGWLLAHNDTHIWQWRPETEELEFIERPPGYAKLSPDGRYLAVADLPGDPTSEGLRESEVILLPLDGTPYVSLADLLRRDGYSTDLTWVYSYHFDITWAANSEAIEISVLLSNGEDYRPTSIVMHVDGRLVLFDADGSQALSGLDCRLGNALPGSYPDPWWLRNHDSIAAVGDCADKNGERADGILVFSLSGEFLRFDPPYVWTLEDEGLELVRAAEGADELGSSLNVDWSPSERHALVTSNEMRSLSLFDAESNRLRPIEIDGDQVPERAAWGCGEAGFCWRASWHEDQRVAVMWHWGGLSSGGYLIDVSDGSSVPIAFWSLGFQSTLGHHEWRPTGDFLMSRLWRAPKHVEHRFSPWDALAALDTDLVVVVIIRSDGTPAQFLFAKQDCRAEGWSPGGDWFVIAGNRVNSCSSAG